MARDDAVVGDNAVVGDEAVVGGAIAGITAGCRLPRGGVRPLLYDELMRLDVTWTPTGPAAIEVLRARLAELRGGSPLAPAVVLTRDKVAALYVRRRLGAHGGVANVQVTTLARFVTQLAGPDMSRSGRRGLPVGAWRQLVRGALIRNPGRFSAVLAHPRTVATVAAALAHLRREGRARRAEVARTPHGRHLIDLLEAVETDMAVAADPWFDDTDEAEAAVAALERDGSGPPVISFLPRPYRPAANGVLAALARSGRLHVVAGLTGAPVADRPLVELLVELGASPPPDWPASVEPTDVTGWRLPDRVIVVPDADIEGRVAVAEVAAAVRAGAPLGTLAVTGPTAEGRRRLGELLDGAGVPWNGPADLPMSASVVGAFILGVLDLPRLNYARQAVLSVLAGAPVHVPVGGPVPVAEWARVSRAANVTEGLDVWPTRLGVYAQRRSADTELCEGLAAMVARLARAVLAEGAGWGARVAAVEGLVDELLGPLGGPVPAGWTEREAVMAAGVMPLLHALAGLDALGGDPPSPEEFRAAVIEALAGPGPRWGKVGVGVTVASPAEVAAGEFDLVVVTGLVEGLAPGRVAADPLLEDLDQGAAENRRAEQLCGLLSAMAAARRAVAITARSGRQVVRRPSRWLLAWCGALEGFKDRALGADDLVGGGGGDYQPGVDVPWHQVVPSFSALARQHAQGSDQDLLLASLQAWVDAGRPPEQHPAVTADPALARAMAVVADFAADTVGPATGAGRAETPTEAFSSSSLSEYTTCPRKFFYHHVLRVAEVIDPADEPEVSGLSRGSLMHDVLDRVVRRHHREHPGEGWSEEEIEAAVADLQAGWAAKQAEGLTGVGAAEEVGLYRLEGVLRRALVEDSRRIEEEGLTLVGTELGFGDRSGGGDPPVWPEVTMTTPAGRTVPFTGRLDRLDRDPEGNLVVTDYKTGISDRRYREPGPDYLQLSLYELVAGQQGQPAQGRYWLLEQENPQRVNLLDADALGRTVDAVLAGMAAGAFPAVPGPGEYNNCTYCRYTMICPADRQAHAEHKAGDPLFQAGVAAAAAVVDTAASDAAGDEVRTRNESRP